MGNRSSGSLTTKEKFNRISAIGGEHHSGDIEGYYRALTVHPLHNYYEGREGADPGSWVRFFIRNPASRDKKRRCFVVEDPVFSGTNPSDSLEMEVFPPRRDQVSGVPARRGCLLKH
jgi:hypothetical protein